MSDSYSAWCEEQEENARIFSTDNIESIKKTTAYKRALNKAIEVCKSIEVCEAKSCAICMHNKYINGHAVCSKIGGMLPHEDLVCKHWRGEPYRVAQPKPNENVIAWLTIEKNSRL